MEQVILVDDQDQATGIMEKMEVHQKGLLHRAFSILLFNAAGQVLLQKRSRKKYHSGGLWTNTCCSHPLPDETMDHATSRKLMQEMGINPPVKFAFKFIYKARLDATLIEHEYDHVYFGSFDGIPDINKEEVEDWKFSDLGEVREDVVRNPDAYTYWFKVIMGRAELDAQGVRFI